MGIHVVRELARVGLPAGVEAVDGGTIGFELAGLLPGRRAGILVDAIDPGGNDVPPGSVFRFLPDEMPLLRHDRRNAHGEGIGGLLHHARHLTPPLDIVVFGIVPGETGIESLDLSPALRSGMDACIAAIRGEIDRIRTIPVSGALPPGIPESNR